MAQINVHVSPEFEQALSRIVRLRGLLGDSFAYALASSQGGPILTLDLDSPRR